MFFSKYGVPAILISDNGPKLRSKAFQQFLSQYNVRHWKTPSYHPQSNATEAANKTIFTAVRAYVRDDRSQRSWDSHLPALACPINSALNTTTKYSPYKILFGYDMITDGQLHLAVERFPGAQTPEKDRVLANIRQRVGENLRTAYEESKRLYDKNTDENMEYAPGQIVWKRNTRLSNANEYYSTKLDDKFVKCRVVRRTGSNTYSLSDMYDNDVGIFSTKMFHSRR